MNTIGGDVLAGLNKGIDLAEKDFHGLVIGNQAANFLCRCKYWNDFYDGCRTRI